MFPARDEVIAYLDGFARERRIVVRTGTRVERIDPSDDGWGVLTPTGTITSRDVIVATGYASEPFVPSWPGRAEGHVPLLHAVPPGASRAVTVTSDAATRAL